MYETRINIPKLIVCIIVAIFLLFGIFGCAYMVDEQHNAVVTVFNAPTSVETAGLHFKIPFISKVKQIDITTHGIGIGYNVSGDGQNVEIADNTSSMITSDFNIINMDFYMEYKVSDPVAYLYNSKEPETCMVNLAQSCIKNVVSRYTVDEAMTTAKGQIESDIKEMLALEMEKQDLGLHVISIKIQDAEPPTDDVSAAFRAVETAKQGAETAKNDALKYQNENLPNAEASADKIIQTAEAYKNSRIAEAEGQVARFNSMYAEYIKYPLITKQRMFYERLESVLDNATVIITDGKTETMYPLKSFVNENGGNTIE